MIAFYEEEMKDASQASSSSMNVGSVEKSSKTFRDGKKKLTVSVQRSSGQPSQVQLGYEER